jgi:hypothetical protein
MEYVIRYRKYYPADSRAEVWGKIPMEEGYAMIAGGMMLDGWLQFSGIEMGESGYVAAEVAKLLKSKTK